MRPSRLTSPDGPSSSPSAAVESPEPMSVEWTDEKHSLYLKSMEASFVNELYDSMEFLRWYPQMKHLSHVKSSKHTNPRATPSQFKVLRSGCWQKINFERGESQVVKTNEAHGSGLLANPWILHFRSARSNTQGVECCGTPRHMASINRANDSDRKKSMSRWGASSSKHFRVLRHEDLHGSKTEVSDQNFVDEDIEEVKSKRVKKVEPDPSSASDQLVPLRKP
ncbi:hypothetical protein L484_000661 [Morus notabilis]|uniref:Uncharacterized protein n=1 Tax=Morus notabilis TaxID=981085 RepID=W9SEB1_9ROSA|nr:uncharacterized protein LOC21384288 [Morus notabilis]EXC41988.1 hypothetical protein L484_000661 [Morus notabilis]